MTSSPAHIDAGIELRKHLERRSYDLERNRRDRHLAAGDLGLGGEALAQLFQFGDVGQIVLGDVRDGIPGLGKVLGGLAADGAHRNLLDRPPLGKVRQLRRRMHESRSHGGSRYGRAGAADHRFSVSLDVIFQDALARAAAAHVVDVDPKFASQTANRGRSRQRRTVLRSGRLRQLRRNHRLRFFPVNIGRKSLFLALALQFAGARIGIAGSFLRSEVLGARVSSASAALRSARRWSFLSGRRGVGSGMAAFRFGGLALGQRKDHLAHFEFVALLDLDLADWCPKSSTEPR